MTNPVDEVEPVIRLCAEIARTTPLTLNPYKYPTALERNMIAVVEAGCRGAISAAILAEIGELGHDF